MTLNDALTRFTQAKSDGSTICVEDYGGVGKNLIIAHATGFCARMYLPMAIELRKHFHCYGIDARNHGGSSAQSDSDANWDNYADDILDAIEQISDDPWVGFGHSYGGAAILLAEQKSPGRFASLYLYEPIVMEPAQGDDRDEPDTENPLSRTALRRREMFATRLEAEMNFASKYPMATFEPIVRDLYLEAGLTRGLDGKLHLSCPRDYESRVYAYARCHHAYEKLNCVSAKVAFVAGETSLDFDISHQQHLSMLTPNSTSTYVDNLGHFGPFENSHRVATHVIATMSEFDTV